MIKEVYQITSTDRRHRNIGGYISNVVFSSENLEGAVRFINQLKFSIENKTNIYYDFFRESECYDGLPKFYCYANGYIVAVYQVHKFYDEQTDEMLTELPLPPTPLLP